MYDDIVASDVGILDLLRKQDSLSVSELAQLLQVTATAVRQRLTRLMAQGYIDRATERAGRGRPSHRYVLTSKGRRKTGANFADLAVALWQEIRAIRDPEVRSGLIQRVARRLAEQYSNSVQGDSLDERLQALADLFNAKRVPFMVERASTFAKTTAATTTVGVSAVGVSARKRTSVSGDTETTEAVPAGEALEGPGGGEARRLPILTALACPYPELAEQDRSVCAMERLLFAEVLGESVRLAKCRLDGDSCCSFEIGRVASPAAVTASAF